MSNFKRFLVWASLLSLMLNPAVALATADNQTLQAPSDVGSVLKGTVWYDPLDPCSFDVSGGGSGSISGLVGKGLSEESRKLLQQVFTAAGAKHDVAPNLVAAIYFEENNGIGTSLSTGRWRDPPPPYGHGAAWAVSPAGATGPFQFLPSTWTGTANNGYGDDGNGDGRKDIGDLWDSAFAGAKYLAATGGKTTNSKGRPGDYSLTRNKTWRDAIYNYNHSPAYVETAMTLYKSLEEGSQIETGGGGDQQVENDDPTISSDLQAIKDKYDLHSVAIQKLNGDTVASKKATDKFTTQGSMLELVALHAALKKGINISDSLTVTNADLSSSIFTENDAETDGGTARVEYKVGASVKVSDVIRNIGRNRLQTPANMLIRYVGGIGALNDFASSNGYTNTNFNQRFTDDPSPTANRTTVGDISKAMNAVYGGNGEAYEVAQSALRQNPYTWGLKSEANATTDNLDSGLGNTGVFGVNGTNYIITVYIADNKDRAISNIKDSTNDIIKKLKDSSGGELDAGAENCAGAGEGGAGSAGANGWDLDGDHGMVYYSQGDPKWSNKPYGFDRIGPCGCGTTSMAMVVSTLKDRVVLPDETSKFSASNGHQAPGCGTAWSLWPDAAQHYGLGYKDLGHDADKIREVIKNGGLVIGSFGPGHFTSNGHLIVIRAITDDGKFLVADPNDNQKGSPAYQRKSKTEWSESIIMGESAHFWGFTSG